MHCADAEVADDVNTNRKEQPTASETMIESQHTASSTSTISSPEHADEQLKNLLANPQLPPQPIVGPGTLLEFNPQGTCFFHHYFYVVLCKICLLWPLLFTLIWLM